MLGEVWHAVVTHEPVACQEDSLQSCMMESCCTEARATRRKIAPMSILGRNRGLIEEDGAQENRLKFRDPFDLKRGRIVFLLSSELCGRRPMRDEHFEVALKRLRLGG